MNPSLKTTFGPLPGGAHVQLVHCKVPVGESVWSQKTDRNVASPQTLAVQSISLNVCVKSSRQ